MRRPRSSSWEERRPRTGGGCAGGVGRLRSGGGGRPAAGAPLGGDARDGTRRDHRIPAAEELAREIDAALTRLGAGGDADEADRGPHEAWSPCMAITISGAGSSGNNDERTAERSGRSGRVIQPRVCHRSEQRCAALHIHHGAFVPATALIEEA